MAGAWGQVIPTNIPFRDQGYGSPMLSQNLIQSLSGPNNLMNPLQTRHNSGHAWSVSEVAAVAGAVCRNDPLLRTLGEAVVIPSCFMIMRWLSRWWLSPPAEEVVAKAVEVAPIRGKYEDALAR